MGGLFFFTPVHSDFGDYLNEILGFWKRHPDIQAAIANDLDRGALDEKRLRQEDQAFAQTRTAPLFAGAEADASKVFESCLRVGRPRTPAVVVFIAAMATGFNGSLYGSGSRTLLLESISLHCLLHDLGYKLPAPHTLGPLVSRLSANTLALIHQAQLADFLAEGLDTFKDLTVDSTAIKASSRWPTDANLIYRLFERSCRLGDKLTRFGLTPLNLPGQEIWLKEVKNSTRAIALLGGGAHRAKRLRQLYDRFYQSACKLATKLLVGVTARLSVVDNEVINLKPSQRQQARLLLEQLHHDVIAAVTTIQQSINRVHNGITTKARDKVLSLADCSAAYIEKGGREAVIGYKPQLARSGAGFVTALILEEGNGADCRQLTPLVKQSLLNTGVTPATVSADDGYASAKGLAEVLSLGVNKVSISGAKGRSLLGEQIWDQPEYSELRCMRSGIESLMFTLKFNHAFGRPGRRGIVAVRSELTFKILAYNFDHALLLRERKETSTLRPQAA